MYSIRLKTFDRVVTARKLNVGTETVRGLSEDDFQSLLSGDTVYIYSRLAPMAEVHLSTTLEKWNFTGKFETIPDLGGMCCEKDCLSALLDWADDCKLVATKSA